MGEMVALGVAWLVLSMVADRVAMKAEADEWGRMHPTDADDENRKECT